MIRSIRCRRAVALALLGLPALNAAAQPANTAPRVDAGPDQQILPGLPALLTGSAVDDELPRPLYTLSADWSLLTGPGNVTFGDPTELLTTASFSTPGVYTLRLDVGDGEFVGSDTLSVEVLPTPLATIRVPQDQPTIQDGIDAADDGDLVLVAPGLYGEFIYINKAVTVASTFYTDGDPALIEQTVLDSPDSDQEVVAFGSSSPADAALVGFTVTGGKDGARLRGGGRILHNRFVDLGTDGVDFAVGAFGLVQHNLMRNNGDDGVDVDNSDVLIADNLIDANEGDGVEIRSNNVFAPAPLRTMIVRANTITGNDDDGIQLIDTDAVVATRTRLLIENNLIRANAQAGFGLMDNAVTAEDYRAASLLERILVFRNTFVGNDYGITGGDNLIALNNLLLDHANSAAKGVDGASVLAYNGFDGNGLDAEDSNLDVGSSLFADPLLSADYGLQPGSPAIDAGSADFTLSDGETVLALDPADYLGAAPDLGAREADFSPPVNQPPVVDAGPDRSAALSDPAVSVSLTLAGTADDDGLPDPPASLTLGWSVVSGPAAVAFGDPTALSTTASFAATGQYLLQLSADDGELSAVDQITVDIGQAAAAVIETRIAAGNDDAEQRASSRMQLDSSDLELVDDFGGAQLIGLRFTGLEIPPGATITRAYLQFQADETGAVATDLTLRAQDDDDPPPFAEANGDIGGRPTTAAAVAWSPPPWTSVGEAGPDQRTPDLAALVQAVVDRPGWNAGNALVLIVDGVGKRTAESFDGLPAAAPLLHVGFTAPAL